MFTEADKQQIEEHGLTVEQVEGQLERFRKGFPAIALDRPCTVGDGILRVPEGEHATLIALHERAAAAGRMMKFVPASGAATRMFRELLVFYQQEPPPKLLTPELTRFFTLLHSFPFYEDLKAVMHRHGQDIDSVLAAQDYALILKYLLTEAGLDYRQSPKALIPFHLDRTGAHTAVAEQMAEACATIQDAKHVNRLHFTVSPQFQDAIAAEAARQSSEGVGTASRFEVTYSTQASDTDTIAVDLGNQPFRDEQGRLVFRPGGHGALLRNLDALPGDIVFIKNIDNVVPASRLPEQALHKKILGGLLVQTQETIFNWIEKLSAPSSTQAPAQETLAAARHFLETGLGIQLPALNRPQSAADEARRIRETLDRPLRICGVVKNVGEPGGGPFWVKKADGTLSKQLIESTQVHRSDP
ncbi:MAG: DUF4301 family protein, partial [Kiloniellales bacterium]|nr:DUF4301 family protein [Kiloniellales bacterium]